MLTDLARDWWLFALRGVLAILFGLVAFVWPGLTAALLVVFLGAWFLVDGAFTLFGAVRSGDHRGMNIFYGIIGVIAGIAVLAKPLIAAVAVTILIAVWAIIRGVLEVSAAVRLRRELEGEWLFVLAGMISVIFGAVIILRPDAGLMAVVWIVGFYAVLFGLLLLALGIRLKHATTATPSSL